VGAADKLARARRAARMQGYGGVAAVRRLPISCPHTVETKCGVHGPVWLIPGEGCPFTDRVRSDGTYLPTCRAADHSPSLTPPPTQLNACQGAVRCCVSRRRARLCTAGPDRTTGLPFCCRRGWLRACWFTPETAAALVRGVNLASTALYSPAQKKNPEFRPRRTRMEPQWHHPHQRQEDKRTCPPPPALFHIIPRLFPALRAPAMWEVYRANRRLRANAWMGIMQAQAHS